MGEADPQKSAQMSTYDPKRTWRETFDLHSIGLVGNPQGGDMQRRKRILVVEDQPDSRRIIRDMLAHTDYEVTEVENGEEALAAIAKQRPDLILMDVQFTRRIKADPALRSIPIIAVTSYALDGEAKVAKAAGCDDYCAEALQPARALGENSTASVLDRGRLLRCMSPPFGTERTSQIARFTPENAIGAARDLSRREQSCY
jgi:two-component system cell cycle response regulator DivK